MRGAPGEARLLASGALLQQAAQASGLVVLLVIVTVLARRLSVSELGAYGLVASLAGYLLVFRNSLAAAAVRAMAAAAEPRERGLVFSTAVLLYVGVGLGTGVLIAAAGALIAATILSGELASDAAAGALMLGAVTAAGLSATILLDALRAERRFVLGASVEIAGVTLHLALMLALIFGGADLAVVIGFSGAMPLASGLVAALVVRARLPWARWRRGAYSRERAARIVPTAGHLLAVELSNLTWFARSTA